MGRLKNTAGFRSRKSFKITPDQNANALPLLSPHALRRMRRPESRLQRSLRRIRRLGHHRILRALGYGEQLFSGELDFQLVKQTIEWKAPARFDQVLEIAVFAKGLGNTSFTLAAEFRVAGSDRLIATAETVYVLVKQHTLTKTPLPPDLRAAMQNGAKGLTTDHAGYLLGSRTGEAV